ncbi:hypothetical protein LXL04_033488 [Taraxacum kok-saghyz]
MYMMNRQVPRVDVGPTSDHLECRGCLKSTLNRLKTVEITSLVGSKEELFFIELLLVHSSSLDTFTIILRGALDAKKALEIVKFVLLFPRASPKQKIIYLNPERIFS